MRREDEIRDYYRKALEEERRNFQAEEERLKANFNARLRGGEKPLRSWLIAAAAALIMLCGSTVQSAGERYSRMPGVEALRDATAVEEVLFGSISPRGGIARYWAQRVDGIHLFGGAKRH